MRSKKGMRMAKAKDGCAASNPNYVDDPAVAKFQCCSSDKPIHPRR